MDGAAYGHSFGGGMILLAILATVGVWFCAVIGGGIIGAILGAPFAFLHANIELVLTGAAWGAGVTGVIATVVAALFLRGLRD